MDIKYQSLRTSFISQNKIESKPNPFTEFFNNLDKFEYYALTLADFDLARYRHLMENYNILELTTMYFSRLAFKELNG